MKITVAQNEAALSYHKVRGLYFVAFIFAATIFYNDIIIFCSCSCEGYVLQKTDRLHNGPAPILVHVIVIKDSDWTILQQSC